MTIEEILKLGGAFTPDGYRFYCNNGDVYTVTYNQTEITDLTLVSKYD